MNAVRALLAVLFAVQSTSRACTGLGWITTQAKLDAASDCESIDDLKIMGADISNLDALANLRTITGIIYLHSKAVSLIDISGLSGVTGAVGGRLHAIAPNLPSLHGLEGITSFSRGTTDYLYDICAIYIVTNDKLVDLQGLSGLTGNIDGGLYLSNLGGLTRLGGLDGVTGFRFIRFNNLGLIMNIAALGSLQSIGPCAGLTCDRSPSFNGLWISGCTLLGSLNALANVNLTATTVIDVALSDGKVACTSHACLQDRGYMGFCTMASLGLGADLRSTQEVDRLRGCDSLDYFSLFRSISYDANRTGVHGTLQAIGVTSIAASLPMTTGGASIVIQENPDIVKTSGLSSLAGKLQGGIRVNANPVLEHLDGLNNITSTASLSIIDNAKLTNVDGLSGLTGHVAGALIITGNDALGGPPAPAPDQACAAFVEGNPPCTDGMCCPSGWSTYGDGSACRTPDVYCQKCALYGNAALGRCNDVVIPTLAPWQVLDAVVGPIQALGGVTSWGSIIVQLNGTRCEATNGTALSNRVAQQCFLDNGWIHGCLPGEFNSSVSGCTACGQGSFSTDFFAARCEPCLANQYQKLTGQTSCAACSDPEAPYTGNNGASCRASCDKGMYVNSTRGCESCPAGTFSQVKNAAECRPCGTTSSYCPEGSTAPIFVPQKWASLPLSGNATLKTGVLHCPDSEGFSCNEGQATMKDNFWRVPTEKLTSDTSILECPVKGACLGSSTGVQQCLEGHSGVFCAVCTDGWAKGDHGNCEKCKPADSIGVGMLVAAASVLFLAVMFALKCLAGSPEVGRARSVSTLTASMKSIFAKALPRSVSERARNSAFTSRLWKSFVVKLKIVTAFSQIIGIVDSVYEIPFPPRFLELLAKLSILSFDFMGFANFGCLPNYNFYGQLVATTLIPLTVMVVLIAIYSRATEPALQGMCIQFLLLFTYLILPSTSTAIFKIYPCVVLDDGTRWLKADYSINCDDGNRAGMLTYAAAMIMVFPMGITFMFGYLLFTNRKSICPSTQEWTRIGGIEMIPPDAESKAEENALVVQRTKLTKDVRDMKQIAFLFREYECRYWWFEAFECIRRLMLTGGTVLFLPGSSTQIVIGMLIALMSIQVYARTQPYLADDNDILAMIAQWAVFFTLFSGLLLKINVSQTDGYDSSVFLALLMLVNLLVIIFGCSSLVYSLWVELRPESVASKPWIASKPKEGKSVTTTINPAFERSASSEPTSVV
jgi:hypothetical protein